MMSTCGSPFELIVLHDTAGPVSIVSMGVSNKGLTVFSLPRPSPKEPLCKVEDSALLSLAF